MLYLSNAFDLKYFFLKNFAIEKIIMDTQNKFII